MVISGSGEPDDAAPAPRSVRHFTLTAGRTASKVELPMEATLRVLDLSAVDWQTGQLRRILEVADTKSVAEVSALLNLPIGVIRVLIGDLVEQDIVSVQATITGISTKDERRELIERTLRGLRAL